jgi:hypothetical protein
VPAQTTSVLLLEDLADASRTSTPADGDLASLCTLTDSINPSLPSRTRNAAAPALATELRLTNWRTRDARDTTRS